MPFDPIDASNYFAAVAANNNANTKEDIVGTATQIKKEDLALRSAVKKNEVSNLTASFASGAGATVSGLGTIGGLLTGNMDNAVVRAGDRATEYWNNRKPQSLLQAEARRRAEVEAAPTQWGKFTAATSQTITDPSLMLSLGASQLPNLVPGAAAGRTASLVGAGVKAASGIGIGTGNLLHSADSAGETYETLMGQTSEADWNANQAYQEQINKGATPEQAKHIVSLGQARQSAAIAGAISLGTNFIPGANIAERYLATPGRAATGIAKGVAVGAVGEGAQEIIEEGSGKLAGNYSIGEIDSTRSIEEGLGEASALGLLGGAAMGAGFGGLSGITASTPEEAQKRAESRSARKQKRQERKEAKQGKAKEETREESFQSGTLVDGLLRAINKSDSPLQERTAAAADFEATMEEVKARKAKHEEDKTTDSVEYANLTELEKRSEVYQIFKDDLDLDVEIDTLEKAKSAKDKETAKGKTKDATPEETETATNDVINKYMIDPTSLSDTDIDEIIASGNLTPEQQSIMTTYSEDYAARNASRSLSAVSESIMNGVKGFKGLEEYDTDIGVAVNKGDIETAATEISSVESFNQQHTDKLAAVNEALQQSKAAKQSPDKKVSNRPARYVYQNPESTVNSGWEISSTAPWKSDKERNQMAGLVIREESSAQLITTMQADNEAIKAALSKYQAMASLKNSSPAVVADTTQEAPATPTPPAEQRFKDNYELMSESSGNKSEVKNVPVTKQQLETLNNASTEALERKVEEWKTKLLNAPSNLALPAKYNPLIAEAQTILNKRKAKPAAKPKTKPQKKPKPKTTYSAETTEESGQLSFSQGGEGGGLAEFEAKRDKAQEAKEIENAQLTYMVTRDLQSVAEGNNALVPDPDFVSGESDKPGEVPLVRSSSTNPPWFQNNPDMKNVEYVRKTVAKYVAGGKLGSTQKRVIDALKDQLAYEEQGGESSESNFDPNSEPTTTTADTATETATKNLKDKDFDRIFEVATKKQEEANNNFGSGQEAQYAFKKEIESGKSIKEAMDAIEDEYYQDFFSYEGHENGWSSLADALTELEYITEETLYADTTTEAKPEVGVEGETNQPLSNDGTVDQEDLNEVLANQLEEQTFQQDEDRELTAEDVLGGDANFDSDPQINEDLDAALDEEAAAQALEEAEYNAEAADLFENNEPDVDYSTFDPNKFVDGFNSGVVEQIDPEQQVEGQLQTIEEVQDTNRVTAYFRQKFNNPNAATPLPLVTTKDFFSTLYKRSRVLVNGEKTIVKELQKKIVNKFYKPKKNFTNEEAGKQKRVLATLSAFVSYYGDLIQENHKSREFKGNDPTKLKRADGRYTQYLEDENGQLPKNVVDAIAVAMFNYISTNGSENGKLNYDAQIRYIKNESKQYVVTEEDRANLAEVGNRKINVIQELGQDIYQILGFSTNSLDVPVNEQEQFMIALGSEALNIMLQRTPDPRNEGKFILPLLDETFVTDDMLLSGKAKGEEDAQTDDTLNVETNQKKKSTSYQPFVRINRQSQDDRGFISFDIDGVTSPFVPVAVDQTEGISSFLPDMFGMQRSKVEVATEPGSFKASTKNADGETVRPKIKKTGGIVPEKLAKILEITSGRQLLVRQDMNKVRNQMSIETAQAIEGIKELKYQQVNLEKSTRSVQEKKRRDWESLATLEQLHGNKPVYLTGSVWSNHRAGNEQNTVDPVDSTYHRHNLYYKEWESVFNITPTQDSDMELRFKLAVGQAIGVDVDKMVKTKNIQEINELFQAGNPATGVPEGIYVPVINVLRKTQKEPIGYKMTAEEEAIVLKAVENAGTEYAALDGLMQYAAYQNAAANIASNPNERQTRNSQKKAQFKAKLMFEVDGLSNGVALSQIQLGILSATSFGLPTSDAASFGFFDQKDAEQYDGYADWKDQTNGNDAYESVLYMAQANIEKENIALADAIMNVLTSGKGIYVDQNQSSEDGININNDFRSSGINSKGRKLVKQPITSINYGAGTKKAINSIGRSIVPSWYEQLQEAANTQGMDGIIQQVNRLNAILDEKMLITWEQVDTIEKAMAFTLTPTQVQRINNQFQEVWSFPLESAIVSKYGKFIERRDQLTLAAEVDYTIYTTAYNYLVAKEQAKIPKLLQEKGEKVAGQDLTQTQLNNIVKELEDMGFRNGIHSALSHSESNYEATIDLSKNNRQTADLGDRRYQQKMEFNNVNKDPNVKGNDNGTIVSRGQRRFRESPGVRGLPMGIQSLDSGISHTALFENIALQLHDAHGLGIKQMYDGAKNLNKATWNLLLDYSVPDAINESLQANWDAAANFKAKYPDTAYTIDNLSYSTIRGDEIAVDEAFVAAGNALVLEMTRDKLTFMANEVYLVDQYSLEGGSYVVTETDRAAAQTKLDAVNEAVTQAVARAEAANQAEPTEPTKKTKDKAPQKKTRTTVSKAVYTGPTVASEAGTQFTPEQTPWGEIDPESLIENSAELESAISKMPRLNMQTLSSAVAKEIKRQTKSGKQVTFNAFQTKLLNKIVSLDLDINVVYVTKDLLRRNALPANITDNVNAPWFAQYAQDANGVQTIYIKSSEFDSSSISSTTLLHEMVHATTEIMISRYKGMDENKVPPKEKAAWKAVQELEKLRAETEIYVNENFPDNNFFKYAVSDLGEFIAIGMTDIAFQSNVLNNIKFDATVARELTAASGWKKFVLEITNLFFNFGGTRTDKSELSNGMATLMALTAITMEQQQLAKSRATKNSSSEVINKYSIDADKSPLSFTTEQIFNALVNNLSNTTGFTAEWKNHLEKTLEDMVGSAFGKNGVIRGDALRSAPVQADDVFLKSLINGDLPFAESLLGTMALNDVEAYAAQSIEIVVRAAFDAKTTKTSQIRQQLRNAYDQAVQNITADDLIVGGRANATADEIAAAEKAYKLIFEPSKGESDSEYLSRFAAATQAYKPLYDALNKLDVPGSDPIVGNSFQRTVSLILSRMADWLSQLVSGVSQGKTVGANVRNAALEASSKMANVEARKQQNVAANTSVFRQGSNYIDQKSLDLQKAVKKAITKLSNNPFFVGSQNSAVEFAGKVGDAIGTDRTDEMIGAFVAFRNSIWEGRNGPLGSIVNEMRNGNAEFDAVNKLKDAGNKIEQLRVRTKAEVGEDTQNAFGKDLDKNESAAMTKAIKLDLSSLLPSFTSTEIEQLLSDPAKLAQAIAVREARLEKIADKETFSFWITKTKDLGNFLATRDATRRGLLLNPRAILDQAGTLKVNQAPRTPESLQDIDQLATLYAIQQEDAVQVSRMSSVARDEANRTDDGNGFEYILQFHAAFKKDALENEFQDNPYSIQKGHIDRITDPNISFKIATKEEGKSLEKAGYKLHSNQSVGVDPLAAAVAKANGQDAPADTFLYVIRDGGLTETVSGAAIIGDKRSMGQDKFPSMYNRITGKVNLRSKDFIRAVNQAERVLSASDPLPADPRKYQPARGGNPDRYMVPVVDSTGQFSNYRYLMSEATEKDLLNPDNRIDQVLGKMASVALGKVTRVQQNRDVIDTAFDIYRARKNTEGFEAQFQVFGPDSKDPVVRERYALMPEESKRYIEEKWGSRSMMIATNQYDILFGYRKYSLVEAFEKDLNDRNRFEKALVSGFTAAFGDKASYYVSQGERGVQAMIRMMKQFLVIKRVMTFVGNELSNNSILAIAGMTPTDIVRDKALALNATVKYVDDRKALDSINRQMEMDLDKIQITAGKRKGQFISQKAATALKNNLESELEANIVAPLMDAGQYSTMVEDLEREPDRYGYRTRMENRIDTVLGGKINNPLVKGARTAGSFLLMTNDTTLYKLMNKATIMSDFTSRYALYKHEMEKEISPKSKEEAIKYARHAFVNYDVPTHKSLQYLNDMGLLLFTKYYLRIQAVIFQMARENPGRFALLATTGGAFGMPTILDASMLAGNNPVKIADSVLGLPNAIGEAAPLAFIGGAL